MATARGPTGAPLNPSGSTSGAPTGAAAGGARPAGYRYAAPKEKPIDTREMSVAARLFAAGPTFDFFQAVRLLEKMEPDRAPIGYGGPATRETVRFRARLSLAFPPSQIYDIRPPAPGHSTPEMVVAFFGLTGPAGVLPRHYSELLLRVARDTKNPEKNALRDWFDLFTHRMLSLFYRAWEKYRFYIPYERRQYEQHPPDPFTHCLLSLSGLGLGTLRNRIRVTTTVDRHGHPEEEALAQVEDQAILRYSGLLARRPRTAAGLAAVLADYFEAPVEVRQFQGEWLLLDAADQSQLGAAGGNCQLGLNLVIGERVWDVEGKIRVRLGPLDYEQFVEFLPYRRATPECKAFFLLSHLVRLYIGPTLEFDVQVLLEPDAVPECILGDPNTPGSRLGWNTWLHSGARTACAEEAVFEGREVFHLDDSPAD